jgi:hypothetical protein
MSAAVMAAGTSAERLKGRRAVVFDRSTPR